MLDILRQLYAIARPSGRKRLLGTLSLVLLQALMQTVAVFSLLPFLSAAADMGKFRASHGGRIFAGLIGGGSDERLLLFAGIGSLLLLVTGNVVTVAVEYARGRFAQGVGDRLRVELVRDLLRRRYAYFLGINTSALVKNLMDDVSIVASSLMLPALDLISRILLVVLLAGMAVIAEPRIVLCGAVLVVLYYLAVMRPVRARAARGSDTLKRDLRSAHFEVQQVLSGVKTILATGSADYFVRRIARISRRVSREVAQFSLYSAIPRSGLEMLVFGGMIAWVLVAIFAGGSLASLIPRVGLIAVVAYRLMPSVQAIFSHISFMTGSRQAAEELTDLMREQASWVSGEAAGPAPEPLHWETQIRFEQVAFRYGGAEQPTLEGIDLTIDKGSRIAIVGATGSGKSTMVDLLLGLHIPTSGRIVIDGTPLTADLMPSWRRAVGYVPQELFLLDASIAENIAFGHEPEQLLEERVTEVAGLAQAREFIDGAAAAGFDVRVGERGVRLSGGQRQRLALARALYGRPNVLVMDEGTSALDPQTEQKVISAMRGAHERLTVVTVTHRLSAVKDYDCIHFLQHGRIAASGDFATLVADCPAFREFAS